jgi:protein TonB
VKRLIPAVVIAIGIHAFLLSTDLDWLNLAGFKNPSADSVTITLESIQLPTTKPKFDPLPPHRYPREINKLAVEKIPKSETPAAPPVKQKPVEATKKPEKKTPLPKPVAAKPKRQDKRQETAPPDQLPPPSPESVPEETSQGKDAPMQPRQEETTAFETAATGPVSNQPAPPSVLEAAQPEYSQNPPISYPRRARRKGYEGTVFLEVLVNRNGKVADLRILASSGYAILDRSAVNSVKTWSFKPAKKGNDTIDMWVKVPVRFKLE